MGRCRATAVRRDILFLAHGFHSFSFRHGPAVQPVCARASASQPCTDGALSLPLSAGLAYAKLCGCFSSARRSFLFLPPPARELTALCSAEEREQEGGGGEEGCLQADNAPQMVEQGCKRVRARERESRRGLDGAGGICLC